MENLVVSLQTAVKLEAAGFPGQTWFRYIKFDLEGYQLSDRIEAWDHKQLDLPHYAAPTAQEIADQLPRSIKNDKNIRRRHLIIRAGKDIWTARYEGNGGSSGATAAEALAALWVKLQEGRA